MTLYYLILAALLLRLTLSPYGTHMGDMNSYIAWGMDIANNGFYGFYDRLWSDYLPGYLYVLAFLGKISLGLRDLPFILPDYILFKFPSIIADLISGWLIFSITQKFVSKKWAIITASIYLFNPAVLANSTLWGQADSYSAMFLLLSLFTYFHKKYLLTGIILGVGQAVKPIAVLFLPFFIISLIKNKSWRNLLILTYAFLITTILLFAPFNNETNILNFIFVRHQATSNQYPFTSLNAFNLWAILNGFWYSDQNTFFNVTLQMWGNILFGLVYLLLLEIFWFKAKTVKNQFILLTYCLALSYIGFFMVFSRMHERHLFSGLTLITLLFPFVSNFSRILIAAIYIIYAVNLAYAYSMINSQPAIFGFSYVLLFSWVNVLIFIYFFLMFIHQYVFKINKLFPNK
jgi:dolichyl-phosphate-mannose-protein mannosyltransferase